MPKYRVQFQASASHWSDVEGQGKHTKRETAERTAQDLSVANEETIFRVVESDEGLLEQFPIWLAGEPYQYDGKNLIRTVGELIGVHAVRVALRHLHDVDPADRPVLFGKVIVNALADEDDKFLRLLFNSLKPPRKSRTSTKKGT